MLNFLSWPIGTWPRAIFVTTDQMSLFEMCFVCAIVAYDVRVRWDCVISIRADTPTLLMNIILCSTNIIQKLSNMCSWTSQHESKLAHIICCLIEHMTNMWSAYSWRRQWYTCNCFHKKDTTKPSIGIALHLFAHDFRIESITILQNHLWNPNTNATWFILHVQ